MRNTLAMVAITALLTGCSGGDGGGDDGSDAAASSTQAAATSNPMDPGANEADQGLLDNLCDAYCERLLAQEQVCPTGTVNLIECGMPLARGIDMVNDLADQVGGLDRSDPERYEDLDRAIFDARAAYDTWSDNTQCAVVFDVHDESLIAIYGQEALFICATQATTAALTQASVGAVLRNASQA